MPRTPRVTVSLVTRNGIQWLPGCLESLQHQDLADFELCAWDNGSTDGTADRLAELAGGLTLRLAVSPVNLGYAAAHNRVLADARGEFVCLLNQDVELDPGFLREAVAAFVGRSTVAAVQGRLLQLSAPGTRTRTLDTTGLVMGRNRRCVSRGQGGLETVDHLVPGPVWGADGPAPVYRRAALMDARLPRRGGGWEILDEDFFSHKEDVDLAWRLQRLGWSAWYAPSAVAWHARQSGSAAADSSMEWVRRYRALPEEMRVRSWRNQRLMQLKNDPLGAVVRDLPWILPREVLSLGRMAALYPGQLRAVPLLLAAAPDALRKRRLLARRVSAPHRAGGPRA